MDAHAWACDFETRAAVVSAPLPDGEVRLLVAWLAGSFCWYGDLHFLLEVTEWTRSWHRCIAWGSVVSFDWRVEIFFELRWCHLLEQN